MNKVLFILLFLVSCSTTEPSRGESLSFRDLSKSSRKELQVKEDLSRYKLNIRVSGDLKNPGSLVILNSEGTITTYFLSQGENSFDININWYDKSCFVEFRTSKENSGFLNIEAEFS